MSKLTLWLLSVSMLMAGCSGAPPMPASCPTRLPPVTAHSLDAYPERLPPPKGWTGPELLADHAALARLYHELRAQARTWVDWMLAAPPGASRPTGASDKE